MQRHDALKLDEDRLLGRVGEGNDLCSPSIEYAGEVRHGVRRLISGNLKIASGGNHPYSDVRSGEDDVRQRRQAINAEAAAVISDAAPTSVECATRDNLSCKGKYRNMSDRRTAIVHDRSGNHSGPDLCVRRRCEDCENKDTGKRI
jgi:hypothetical protein